MYGDEHACSVRVILNEGFKQCGNATWLRLQILTAMSLGCCAMMMAAVIASETSVNGLHCLASYRQPSSRYSRVCLFG